MPTFSPGHEVGIDDLVWEAELANPNSLENAVASELMHHQRRIHQTRLLHFVWNDASRKGAFD